MNFYLVKYSIVNNIYIINSSEIVSSYTEKFAIVNGHTYYIPHGLYYSFHDKFFIIDINLELSHVKPYGHFIFFKNLLILYLREQKLEQLL